MFKENNGENKYHIQKLPTSVTEEEVMLNSSPLS